MKELEKLLEAKIDRTKWIKWKFSDLVDNIVEKVVPKESGLKNYIGLEHLDSGSLKICRFGDTASLTGDKLKIYKGDLIFAKRNAYLKRVAIADFDAVASAHSLVLRPKQSNVLPRFLPFFLLSERFWDRAIAISVGSLSPTINWKTIAKQEFLIPPVDQQDNIADLLWSVDSVVDSVLRLRSKIETLKNSILKRIKEEFFDKKNCVNEGEFLEGRLDSFFQLQRGFDLTKKNSVEGTVPVISSSGLSYYHNESKCMPPGAVTGRKGKLGDVFYLDEPYWPHDTSLWVKDFMGNEPKFVYWFLKSIKLETFNAATAVPTLNRNVLHPLIIRFPNNNEQLKINRKLDEIEQEQFKIDEHLIRTQQLYKSLINQIF